jgi:hypothetical protein
MSIRNISWGGKGSRCNLHVLTVSKSGILNLLEPYGPVIGLYRDCYLTYIHTHTHVHMGCISVAYNRGRKNKGSQENPADMKRDVSE